MYDKHVNAFNSISAPEQELGEYCQNFFSRQYISTPTSETEIEKIHSDPGFGKYFTDHMVMITYTQGQGWHSGRVVPFGPLSLLPSAGVLHYAQEIFEGLKVYRQPDGTIATFRPQENARRFQASARRLVMPELPIELFVRSIEELLMVDHAFVPPAGGEASLYIRPVLFASSSVIGLNPAEEYTYVVFGSPAAPIFKGGALTPVSVWVSRDYVRAAPGGTGAAKCGGNYSASLIAQEQAIQQGCQQVIWLDAIERTYIEEMGGMNLFFVYNDKIITPELSGSLLPGITRASLLILAQDMGLTVSEEKISIEQVIHDARLGKLREIFACGTAAVITPVGAIKTEQETVEINSAQLGEVTFQLREQLTGIQRGVCPDIHGWMHPLTIDSALRT